MKETELITVGTGIMSPVGWIPDEGIGYDVWDDTMQKLLAMDRALNWLIGDGLNYGERRYGDMYTQAIEVTEWNYQRLADAKWVAASVPYENRREELTWTHHRHVAKLPPDIQRVWLDMAIENNWTTVELFRGIAGKTVDSGSHLIVSSRKRDAKRMFVEMASAIASGDGWEWASTLTREEVDSESWKEVRDMWNTAYAVWKRKSNEYA